MTVVQFERPKSRIWTCNCGCSTFSIYEDGAVACAACDAVQSVNVPGTWFTERAAAPEREDEIFRDVQGNGSVEFAKARLRKMAQDDDLALIVVAKEGGAVSTWAAAETKEQAVWTIQRLRDAIKLIKGRNYG